MEKPKAAQSKSKAKISWNISSRRATHTAEPYSQLKLRDSQLMS